MQFRLSSATKEDFLLFKQCHCAAAEYRKRLSLTISGKRGCKLIVGRLYIRFWAVSNPFQINRLTLIHLGRCPKISLLPRVKNILPHTPGDKSFHLYGGQQRAPPQLHHRLGDLCHLL